MNSVWKEGSQSPPIGDLSPKAKSRAFFTPSLTYWEHLFVIFGGNPSLVKDGEQISWGPKYFLLQKRLVVLNK